MKVLIDNGHGEETKGKRSPDGRIREYAYARKVAVALVRRLKEEGIHSIQIVPEDYDVSLRARCTRANMVADKNKILISIHLDAAGGGSQWMGARGWSARISPKASEKSKTLASCLAKAAEAHGLKVRRQYPDKDYWLQNLAICRDTVCPAVLTENLFQDNLEDVAYLLTEEGFNTIVDLHVEGIKEYLRLIDGRN